jgi:DNA polymerase-3 subunit alpha
MEKKPKDVGPINQPSGKSFKEDYIQKRKQQFYDDIEEAVEDNQPYYFVFDIETNGLPNYYDAPPEDLSNWPQPLSIGFLILNENLQLIRKKYYILKQDCELDEEALSINGLSKDLIEERGQNPELIYDEIFLELKSCKRIVAHNIEFDLTILHSDFIRKGKKTTVFKKAKFCTMKKSTTFVAIPRMYGNGYKWPKLGELVSACFFLDETTEGFEFEEAHDALWDAEATAKCFIYLLQYEDMKA